MTGSYTYEYPLPAVAVDMVILTISRHGQLSCLLVRRGGNPFQGAWALPGGFVDVGAGYRAGKAQGEDLRSAAVRELREETGLEVDRHQVFLEQLYTFGAADRDPRGRVITVAYYALVSVDFAPFVRAGDDAHDVRWQPVLADEDALSDLPLAFDHEEIIRSALERVRGKIDYDPRLVRALLPDEFTQSEFRRVHEMIKGARYDKSNFSKRFRRMLEDGRFEATDATKVLRGAGRPPKLYRFVESGRRSDSAAADLAT